MILVINPSAAGGSGIKKWNRIERRIRATIPFTGTFLLNGRASTGEFIRRSLQEGETQFIAAGGDGTVNALLNELLFWATPGQRSRIQLGAIGLGSSNDFHKPCEPFSLIEGIPGKLSFQDTPLRDVGCISFERDGGFLTRYFLVNASVGITAEANLLFNDPGRFLNLLKRASTPAAILFAALKTIVAYKNLPISAKGTGFPERDLQLTNLNLLKSPHVSGSFCYGARIPLDNGFLRAYLSTRMTKLELLRLMWDLSGGSFHPGDVDPARATTGAARASRMSPKVESFELQSMSVTSSEPFAVEYDGEVVATRFAQFSVLPRHLQVCRS
jgi:diacylglycerol kinase (ATP)